MRSKRLEFGIRFSGSGRVGFCLRLNEVAVRMQGVLGCRMSSQNQCIAPSLVSQFRDNASGVCCKKQALNEPMTLQQPFTHSLRNFRRCFLNAVQLQMLLQDLLDFLADMGVWNEQGDTPMQADIRECPGEQSPRRFRL